MSLLERRLDNVVCRLGLRQFPRQSRMMITHGHITVNGRLVNIPSYLVRAGDAIRVKKRPKSTQLVEAIRAETKRDVPDFLSVVEEPGVGRPRPPLPGGGGRFHPRADATDRGALLEVARSRGKTFYTVRGEQRCVSESETAHFRSHRR